MKMKPSEIITVCDYNDWANRRIREAASRVTPEQFTTPKPFPFGSLRGTLVHIMDAEYGWRTMIENAGKTDRWQAEELLEKDFPTLKDIDQRWQAEEASMRRYVAGLNDEGMEQIIRYVTDEGNLRERPLWHCLYHLVNHGTQHRSEAAAMLTEFGASPGDLDFTVFMNTRR
jgi:uncharacterized damage-inducible protein DinB